MQLSGLQKMVLFRLREWLDMEEIYIGVGSNVGDRRANLNHASRRLSEYMVITNKSQVYETEPQYLLNQAKFLNAVVCGHTELEPLDMLNKLKQLETALGRVAGPRNGPRLIDLDLLYYGRRCISTDILTVPHPRIQERYFVLRPLLDIAPSLKHPTNGKTVKQLISELPIDTRRATPALMGLE